MKLSSKALPEFSDRRVSKPMLASRPPVLAVTFAVTKSWKATRTYCVAVVLPDVVAASPISVTKLSQGIIADEKLEA